MLRFILPILVLGLGLGIYRLLQDTKAAPEPLQQDQQSPVVSAQFVRYQSLAPELTLFGRIEAPYNSVLSASIAATVVQVTVQEGKTVQSGDVMIQLDDTDAALRVRQTISSVAEIEAQTLSDQRAYQADREALEREQAMLALTQKAVVRATQLVQTNAGTQAALDEVLQQEEQLLLAITQRRRSIDDYQLRRQLWQARLDNAEAARSFAELDLSRTRIRAPYQGKVIEVLVSPGDRATPGTPLVRVFDHLNLEVRAQVPSRYISRLRQIMEQGGEIEATLRNEQEVIHLKLNRLAAAVVSGQGGVDVFFHAKTGAFPALGSTVELVLALPPVDGVVALPQDAIYGNNRIYRIVENRLKSVMVPRLGQRSNPADGQPQLLMDGSVLDEGDLIMISKLPYAIDGLIVEPVVMDE